MDDVFYAKSAYDVEVLRCTGDLAGTVCGIGSQYKLRCKAQTNKAR
jgi:hypothetical protein